MGGGSSDAFIYGNKLSKGIIPKTSDLAYIAALEEAVLSPGLIKAFTQDNFKSNSWNRAISSVPALQEFGANIRILEDRMILIQILVQLSRPTQKMKRHFSVQLI